MTIFVEECYFVIRCNMTVYFIELLVHLKLGCIVLYCGILDCNVVTWFFFVFVEECYFVIGCNMTVYFIELLVECKMIVYLLVMNGI
jgi:hypothetical protein